MVEERKEENLDKKRGSLQIEELVKVNMSCFACDLPTEGEDFLLV